MKFHPRWPRGDRRAEKRPAEVRQEKNKQQNATGAATEKNKTKTARHVFVLLLGGYVEARVLPHQVSSGCEVASFHNVSSTPAVFAVGVPFYGPYSFRAIYPTEYRWSAASKGISSANRYAIQNAHSLSVSVATYVLSAL